jgi:hypothetical protein
VLLHLQFKLRDACYCTEGLFYLGLTPYSLTTPSNEVNYVPQMCIVLAQIISTKYGDETLHLLLYCSQASAFTNQKCDEFYLRAKSLLFTK